MENERPRREWMTVSNAEALGTFIGGLLVFLGMVVGGGYIVWWLIVN